MKWIGLIFTCTFLSNHLFSQTTTPVSSATTNVTTAAAVTDTVASEKQLKEKLLNDIQQNLSKKNDAIDSTIRKIDTRVDKIDSMLKTTTSAKEKAEKLLERVQVVEDKQKALEENELNIYQANYQSAIINLLSMEREIKPLVLFNATKNFFDELSSVSNPTTYPGYQEWFKKFKEYIQKNKQRDVNLNALDNFIKISETVSSALPLTGAASQVMFTGMSNYINSISKKEKELKTESEKMFELTLSLSQFTEEKDKIEYEWKEITKLLQQLQEYYDKTLTRNLSIISIDKNDFMDKFSKENDADKRYLYLSAIRQKTAQVVSAFKNSNPKEWKEKIYFELADVQTLKLKYGDITSRISRHITEYELLIKKFKNDKNLSSRMDLLESKLNTLKDTFDKAFEPSDYTNSIYRMYKVQ
ncbi:MAG: hypothetical protein KGO81_09900 [Bacteroidota bacterium]|nr:hypothetical protein [Bacteroidota bacterium]